MIGKAAEILTRALGKQVEMTENETQVYRYAFDIMLYTIVSTLALLLIGAAAGRFVDAVICISTFYMFQSFGGGYHANSHGGCFMTMVAGLFLFLISFRVSLPVIADAAIGLGALALLLWKPLVLHRNKMHLAAKKGKLIRRSVLVTVCCLCIFVAVIIWGNTDYIHALSASFLLCAVSRLTAFGLNAYSAKNMPPAQMQ